MKGKQYLLTFTALLFSEKGYKLFFNIHNYEQTIEQRWRLSFPIWSTFRGVIEQGMREARKVKGYSLVERMLYGAEAVSEVGSPNERVFYGAEAVAEVGVPTETSVFKQVIVSVLGEIYKSFSGTKVGDFSDAQPVYDIAACLDKMNGTVIKFTGEDGEVVLVTDKVHVGYDISAISFSDRICIERVSSAGKLYRSEDADLTPFSLVESVIELTTDEFIHRLFRDGHMSIDKLSALLQLFDSESSTDIKIDSLVGSIVRETVLEMGVQISDAVENVNNSVFEVETYHGETGVNATLYQFLRGEGSNEVRDEPFSFEIGVVDPIYDSDEDEGLEKAFSVKTALSDMLENSNRVETTLVSEFEKQSLGVVSLDNDTLKIDEVFLGNTVTGDNEFFTPLVIEGEVVKSVGSAGMDYIKLFESFVESDAEIRSMVRLMEITFGSSVVKDEIRTRLAELTRTEDGQPFHLATGGETFVSNELVVQEYQSVVSLEKVLNADISDLSLTSGFTLPSAFVEIDIGEIAESIHGENGLEINSLGLSEIVSVSGNQEFDKPRLAVTTFGEYGTVISAGGEGYRVDRDKETILVDDATLADLMRSSSGMDRFELFLSTYIDREFDVYVGSLFIDSRNNGGGVNVKYGEYEEAISEFDQVTSGIVPLMQSGGTVILSNAESTNISDSYLIDSEYTVDVARERFGSNVNNLIDFDQSFSQYNGFVRLLRNFDVGLDETGESTIRFLNFDGESDSLRESYGSEDFMFEIPQNYVAETGGSWEVTTHYLGMGGDSIATNDSQPASLDGVTVTLQSEFQVEEGVTFSRIEENREGYIFYPGTAVLTVPDKEAWYRPPVEAVRYDGVVNAVISETGSAVKELNDEKLTVHTIEFAQFRDDDLAALISAIFGAESVWNQGGVFVAETELTTNAGTENLAEFEAPSWALRPESGRETAVFLIERSAYTAGSLNMELSDPTLAVFYGKSYESEEVEAVHQALQVGRFADAYVEPILEAVHHARDTETEVVQSVLFSYLGGNWETEVDFPQLAVFSTVYDEVRTELSTLIEFVDKGLETTVELPLLFTPVGMYGEGVIESPGLFEYIGKRAEVEIDSTQLGSVKGESVEGQVQYPLLVERDDTLIDGVVQFPVLAHSSGGLLYGEVQLPELFELVGSYADGTVTYPQLSVVEDRDVEAVVQHPELSLLIHNSNEATVSSPEYGTLFPSQADTTLGDDFRWEIYSLSPSSFYTVVEEMGTGGNLSFFSMEADVADFDQELYTNSEKYEGAFVSDNSKEIYTTIYLNREAIIEDIGYSNVNGEDVAAVVDSTLQGLENIKTEGGAVIELLTPASRLVNRYKARFDFGGGAERLKRVLKARLEEAGEATRSKKLYKAKMGEQELASRLKQVLKGVLDKDRAGLGTPPTSPPPEYPTPSYPTPTKPTPTEPTPQYPTPPTPIPYPGKIWLIMGKLASWSLWNWKKTR